MKERILAIVAAVALVAVAIAARSVLVGDDAEAEGGGGRRPVVACTADLMSVCDALAEDGRIAADPPTLDLNTGDRAAARAQVGDRALDGWITWDPAPAVANLDATEAGDRARWGAATPVGTAALAVATSPDLALPDGCTTAALDWACLLAAADDGAAVGVGTGRTAESLARLYPIARTLAEDDDFRSIDGSRLRTLIESPLDSTDRQAYAAQVRTLRVKRGALNLVVAPAATIEEASLRATPATPAASMTAVAVGRAEADLDLTKALASARVSAAVRALGLTVDPDVDLAPEARAGELYQVREKVG